MNQLILVFIMQAMNQMDSWPPEKIINFTHVIDPYIHQAIVSEEEVTILKDMFDVKYIYPAKPQG